MKSTKTDYEAQGINFLNATSTSLVIKYKAFGKHFSDDKEGRHIFSCRLKNDLGSYSFDFGQSISAGNKQPSAYDILSCLTKYDPESYEDFCDEFGYERYSSETGRRNMQTYRIYLAVLKEWRAVDRLFTEEQLEILTEIQ